MKFFIINRAFSYEEKYLPTKRHRVYRYRTVKDTVKLRIRMVTSEEAPVAFLCNDYSHVEKHQREIRFYKGKLYRRDYRTYTSEERDAGLDGYKALELSDVEKYIERGGRYIFSNDDRETVLKKLKEGAANILVVDGIPYWRCGEPMYVVNTFGLGHNHGGTEMFVEHHYNNNIPNTNYFNALEGEKAVAYANRIAAARGDTDNVGKFEAEIEVLIPEAVKHCPMKEHGEGNDFINSINAITETSNSAMEAGLLAMALAFSN